VHPAHREMLFTESEPDALIQRLKDYEPAMQDKWLEEKWAGGDKPI